MFLLCKGLLKGFITIWKWHIYEKKLHILVKNSKLHHPIGSLFEKIQQTKVKLVFFLLMRIKFNLILMLLMP